MSENGFTLIELLAVIVVLAIIALIGTPIVLNMIDNAKKGANEQSIITYVKALETKIVKDMMSENKNAILSGTYDINNYSADVTGKKPTSGEFTVNENGIITEALFIINGMKIEYSNGVAKTIDDKKGLIAVKSTNNETYDAIIYLDPTDLNKRCTENDVLKNYQKNGIYDDIQKIYLPTEIKNGCMKWYAYKETEDEFTMILDHNTTARVIWNTTLDHTEYENSNIVKVLAELADISKWKVTPRIISAKEINEIVGIKSFDYNDTNGTYHFDNKSSIEPDYSSNRSNYDWLYNYTHGCKTDTKDYGCTIEDNNSYKGYENTKDGTMNGYWTSTVTSTYYVWDIYKHGKLDRDQVNDSRYGVRPVITVSKSLFSK